MWLLLPSPPLEVVLWPLEWDISAWPGGRRGSGCTLAGVEMAKPLPQGTERFQKGTGLAAFVREIPVPTAPPVFD